MNRNIDACKQLSMMTRSALGPHGKSITISHDLPSKKELSRFYEDNQYGALLSF